MCKRSLPSQANPLLGRSHHKCIIGQSSAKRGQGRRNCERKKKNFSAAEFGGLVPNTFKEMDICKHANTVEVFFSFLVLLFFLFCNGCNQGKKKTRFLAGRMEGFADPPSTRANARYWAFCYIEIATPDDEKNNAAERTQLWREEIEERKKNLYLTITYSRLHGFMTRCVIVATRLLSLFLFRLSRG